MINACTALYVYDQIQADTIKMVSTWHKTALMAVNFPYESLNKG